MGAKLFTQLENRTTGNEDEGADERWRTELAATTFVCPRSKDGTQYFIRWFVQNKQYKSIKNLFELAMLPCSYSPDIYQVCNLATAQLWHVTTTVKCVFIITYQYENAVNTRACWSKCYWMWCFSLQLLSNDSSLLAPKFKLFGCKLPSRKHHSVIVFHGCDIVTQTSSPLWRLIMSTISLSYPVCFYLQSTLSSCACVNALRC